MLSPSIIQRGVAAFLLVFGSSIGSAAIVAEWRFNDGSGAIAKESSINNYDGTLTNFADLSAGAGGDSGWTNDGRLAFDGTNDYIVTGFPLNSLSGSSFTLEVIVSHDNPAQTWSPILGSSQTNTANIFFLGKQMSSDAVNFNFAGLGNGNTLIPFADGQRHHLAMVFNDTADTLTLYVDSVERFQRTGVTGILNAPSNLLIGAVGHSANERWNGTADHVRISNTALMPAQFIPEPGTGMFVIAGLLTLGARRRRKGLR